MELTLQHNYHRHQHCKSHQGSAPRPSSVLGPVHTVELPATVEWSQRPTGSGCRGPESHSNSHGIHTVLATQPLGQSPDTAARKELYKGNTKIICMPRSGHPQSRPLTWAECALGLGPERPSASSTSFMEPNGNGNKPVKRGGAFFPSPEAHSCQLQNNSPLCLISWELRIP